MSVITYHPLYCVLVLIFFFIFGIPSRKFLAPPLSIYVRGERELLPFFNSSRGPLFCSPGVDDLEANKDSFGIF